MTDIALSGYDYRKHWQGSNFGGGSEHTWDQFILPYLIPGSVLDVGCAAGRFTETLTSFEGFNGDYMGIDISHSVIPIIQQLYPGRSFQQADIVTWKPKRTWDNIFTWTTLEHIPPEHIKKVANKLKRLGKNIVMGEPFDPEQGDEQWAAHCFNHNYEQLFDITDRIHLGSVWVFKARGHV